MRSTTASTAGRDVSGAPTLSLNSLGRCGRWRVRGCWDLHTHAPCKPWPGHAHATPQSTRSPATYAPQFPRHAPSAIHCSALLCKILREMRGAPDLIRTHSHRLFFFHMLADHKSWLFNANTRFHTGPDLVPSSVRLKLLTQVARAVSSFSLSCPLPTPHVRIRRIRRIRHQVY